MVGMFTVYEVIKSCTPLKQQKKHGSQFMVPLNQPNSHRPLQVCFFWDALVFLYTRQDGHDVRLAALEDAKAKEAGGACGAVAFFFDGGPQHQHGHVQWGIEWFWMVLGSPTF